MEFNTGIDSCLYSKVSQPKVSMQVHIHHAQEFVNIYIYHHPNMVRGVYNLVRVTVLPVYIKPTPVLVY